MIWKRIVPLLAVLTAGLSAAAFAFTVQTVDGRLLRWQAGADSVMVAASLPFADWFAAAERAAAHWAKAGQGPRLVLAGVGDAAAARRDGRAILSLAPLESDQPARTMLWFRPSTGEITRAEVQLNDQLVWRADDRGPADRPDLAAALLAEFGHLLGLGEWADEAAARDGLAYLYPARTPAPAK